MSGTTHTTAGSYTDTWTFAGNANYASASGTITDVITQPGPTSHLDLRGLAQPAESSSIVDRRDLQRADQHQQPDLGRLTLTVDGGSNLINGGVSLSLVSGDMYAIGGLSFLTTAEGEYTLTVDSADIQDQDGVAGTNSLRTPG